MLERSRIAKARGTVEHYYSVRFVFEGHRATANSLSPSSLSGLSSEGAPVPLPRCTFGHTFGPLGTLRSARDGCWGATSHWVRRAAAALRTGTIGPRESCSSPHFEVRPATIASSLVGARRMEARVLVKWDHVNGVIAAEDVSAAAAVVTSIEECELPVAGVEVASLRRGIRLEQ